ncbi:MAG TPA: hypothetical protein PK566_03565 [Pseudobacteroides sp.]|nr:hypothetical protein [Pseudobacteroides sp.]
MKMFTIPAISKPIINSVQAVQIKPGKNISAILEETSASSKEIAASSEELSETAEKVFSTVENLRDTAKDMIKQVNSFKL